MSGFLTGKERALGKETPQTDGRLFRLFQSPQLHQSNHVQFRHALRHRPRLKCRARLGEDTAPVFLARGDTDEAWMPRARSTMSAELSGPTFGAFGSGETVSTLP